MLDANFLSITYAGLMALAIFVYAILDGYDLGVGILLPLNNEPHSDAMIASIGPYWDANETWLVLAVGLALIAFPVAHSIILQALYIPVTIMLLGLILRGVAFDFRAKAKIKRKAMWDRLFKLGSFITAFSQGFMLGLYIFGFEYTMTSTFFAIVSGFGVTSAYTLIGASWLILKTENELQNKAIQWCKAANKICFIGVLTVSILNLFVNSSVFQRWFEGDIFFLMLPMPLICFCLFILMNGVLNYLNSDDKSGDWLPFLISVFVFVLCYFGLVYSFYPYIIPNKLTIFDALAAEESLNFLFYGVVVVVPTIILYTLFLYKVFWGKVKPLSYY